MKVRRRRAPAPPIHFAIRSIARLRMQPGDVLVVRIPSDAPPDEAIRMCDHIHEHLGFQVLLMSRNVSLSVLASRADKLEHQHEQGASSEPTHHPV